MITNKMAAPLRQSFKPILLSVSRLSDKPLGNLLTQNTVKQLITSERHFSFKSSSKILTGLRNVRFQSTIPLIIGGSAALFVSSKLYSSYFQPTVVAESSLRPEFRVSRKIIQNDLGIDNANRMSGVDVTVPHAEDTTVQVHTETDHSGLKLTLYQFQTCPFCCKVRALLDYHGFCYDVIEVNSVTKKQIKWSDYRKVPILVAQLPGKEEVILKESTVIISVLESFLHDRSTSLDKLNSYFPCLEETVGGKKKYDYPNKYFIMFQEKVDVGNTPKQREEERKWRKWTDDNLVHMLSPNVYRTASEALQAFYYFSDVGEWKQNFSTLERYTVIYVGAAVMYVIGKMLKHKYKLKDDVRQSLYDSCNEWMRAVGKDRKFMGGDQPNLADLSVYGVLNSIEGCTAFQEALDHTMIGPWYKRTKDAIQSHQGSHPLNRKTTPSNLSKGSKK